MTVNRVSDDEIMGRNEYARHQGVTPNAVAKAIRSGRITSAVQYGKGGRVDGIRWRLADKLWRENTDIAEAVKTRTRLGPAMQTSAPEIATPISGSELLAQHKLSMIISEIFDRSAIAWAAWIVYRHKLTPAVARDILQGGLLGFNVAACGVLGSDSDEMHIPEILSDTLSGPTLNAVLAAIEAEAAAFAAPAESADR